MEESLPPEHGCELFTHSLEQFLDGSGVTNEGRRHLESPWRDVTHSCLHIVGDPFHKEGRVLVLDIVHLVIHFPHGHAATEDGGHGEVAAVPWVTGGHHVLGVKHLLGKLGDCEGTVLLGATGGEGSKAGHEEMKSREGHHVDSQLAEISIELAGEPQAGGDTGHGQGN